MPNILTDPLIRFDRSDGARRKASLPEVYAALMADEVNAFPALRPHQRHAWHAFLVQLGAMAMHRAGTSEPPSNADAWAGLIQGLTPDFPDDEPWHLVVDDILKPAFMQAPARSTERENEYKSVVSTPDELDMLVTSKNHDLKSAVAAQASVDDWIFALVTLQTMAGYDGRFTYGISRMPSGYGNRSSFSFSPSFRPGIHTRYDLVALLKNRQSILDAFPMVDLGICLLWVHPWDGTKTEVKQVTELDPFYIEVCRRVRLHQKYGRLVAACANTEDSRIFDVKGLVGDPWMPVSNNTNPNGTPPAFLGSRKFGYERVVDGLLSPDWKPPALLRSAQFDKDSDGDMYLIARGMVRGQGGTEGYHERVIVLRPKTAQVFGTPPALKKLEDIARERIEQINIIERILRHAVATLAAQGNSDPLMHKKGKPSPNDLAQSWTNKWGEVVDARFFEALQDEFEEDDLDKRKVIRCEWLMGHNDSIVDRAHAILRQAGNALPCPTIDRYKTRVRADSVFWGRMYGLSGLPYLFARSDEGDEE